MAGIPLNTFKTVVKHVHRPTTIVDGEYILNPTPSDTYFQSNGDPPAPNTPGFRHFLVYTAPLGITGVILYAQVSTTASTTKNVSLWHYRPNISTSISGFTQLVNKILLPANDALSIIGGKLVLETGDSLYISSDDAIILQPVAEEPSKAITDISFTISILESANQ